MVTNDRTADEEKTTAPLTEAWAYSASWDVFYQDAQGLECHLQLKSTTEEALLKLAGSASVAIIESGGRPSSRMAGRGHAAESAVTRGDEGANNGKVSEPGNGNGNGVKNNGEAKNGNGVSREPTFVDERGVRRCNRRLADGTVCGQPVSQKEGRYGTFWSCPNFRSHAPNGAK